MKAVLWVSFYFMTFIGLIAGMYLSKDRIVAETEAVPFLNSTPFHEYVSNLDSTSLHLVDSLGVVMEGMLGQMGSYVMEMQSRDSTIQALKSELDQLYTERENLNKRIEALEESSKDKVDQEKELQDLAKILGTMNADVLSPILQNLPDDVIRIVYDKAKSKDRATILNSLAPERAGKIMRDMAIKRNKKAADAKQTS
jgi:flagellar motility protein MotE (MotC chaperone)